MRKIFFRNIQFFGKESVNKIKNSEVAVCGVGGLGCVVADILTRMGVGKIKLLDKGIVDEPDIGRQLLYDYFDIGKKKVAAAKEKLIKIRTSKIESYMVDIQNDNLDFLETVSVVADCLDNYSSRYSLENIIKEHQFLVHGSVENSYGQITTIKKKETVKLKELYFGLKEKEEIAVSTPAVFFVGTLMAEEIINCILLKPKLKNTLLVANLSDFSLSKIPLSID
ncbi:HesA/MoeB/ThiF family protein [Hippea alviniae]|uniref:HesA/MoeB/ThiF family protein n=1 Tax=Hippea alviniae TaxID=1279027 RepID=UPI0003B4B198|nr:ThiF family adenylyltransferase [Hippea alviniae]